MTQIAFKFHQSQFEFDEGWEVVLFQKQMLRDVYFHEGDPLPPLDVFLYEPLSRPDGQMFWVYRQGTFIGDHLIAWGLYLGIAKTEDLDASEESIEHYHHVPTISLEGGGRFEPFKYRTRRKKEKDLLKLYEDVKHYGNPIHYDEPKEKEANNLFLDPDQREDLYQQLRG